MLRRMRFPLYFMLLSGFLLNSCKKDKATEVIIEYPIVFYNNLEIDMTKVDTFVERESYDFPTQLDGELARNNTSKEKIKSAKLILFRLQVFDYAYADSNKYGNLRDISAMELDIKKDGIGQQLVAKKMIPDIYTKAVNLDLLDVELRDYLKQDQFKMVIRYKKRRQMPNEMPFIISAKFRIVADPL